MPTKIYSGSRVNEVELLDIFPADEGMIAQIYGRIGSGKTYVSTRMALDFLRRGKVVYVNWKIHYIGYDERSSPFRLFVSLLFPWIKRFYAFPQENLRYFEISDKWAVEQGFKDFDAWVASRTDCIMFADEGHVWVDSYAGTRMSIDRRTTILHTRHYNRSIYIISQRPTAIHVSMRANVNVFYKCEKLFKWGNIVRFKLTEYQDMANESVDEDEEKIISKKYYWGRKDVFQAYDTKYLRGETKQSQRTNFYAFKVKYIGRLWLFILGIIDKERLYKAISEPVDNSVDNSGEVV